MANLRSSIKRMRQNDKRRLRNRMLRTRTRTFIKRANALIAAGDKDEAMPAVRQAISQLDRASQKGILHGNNAARCKSRLVKKLNTLE